MHANLANLSEKEISRLLNAGEKDVSAKHFTSEFPYPPEFLTGPPRPAAVLIPFLRKEDQWHLLYTRRNASLVEHSGQVAFPGGRADQDDSGPVSTALREAREEIGLQPEDVRILGALDEFLTITNYLVTPVVGVIPWPYNLRLSPIEVSRAFTIPLEWLADPNNYEEKQRSVPRMHGSVTVIYYNPYDGEVLWGATARFTLTLLKKLNLNGSKKN